MPFRRTTRFLVLMEYSGPRRNGDCCAAWCARYYVGCEFPRRRSSRSIFASAVWDTILLPCSQADRTEHAPIHAHKLCQDFYG